MATELQTEANYFNLDGIVLAQNDTEAAATDHADADHAADSGHGEAAAHTEVHGEEHGSSGMPQLDTSTYANQIFWLVLCLIAIYIIFSRIALPRIGGTISNRVQTIQRDLDRAAEMKMKAEEAEEQYNKALADARTHAHEIAEKTKASIQSEVDAATAKADAEIAKQSESSAKRIAKLQKDAEASVQDVATDVAKAILDKMAPSVADEKAIAGAVNKVLKG